MYIWYSRYSTVIKEYLRLSSFELAFVLCESGALSTEPPPARILTAYCTHYTTMTKVILQVCCSTAVCGEQSVPVPTLVSVSAVGAQVYGSKHKNITLMGGLHRSEQRRGTELRVAGQLRFIAPAVKCCGAFLVRESQKW